jgi:DNA polymerase III delta prime subunit
MLHAWLVTGPKGPARRMASRRLAASLIGAGPQEALVLEGHHPDVREYSDPLRIDDVREIASSLARPPLLGGGRALVLAGLAEATQEAQNALLRMVEEPPSDTYFVTEAESQWQVLPTLRSRLGVHPMPRLDPGEIASGLREARPTASQELVHEAAGNAHYLDEALTFLDALAALDEALPADDGQEDWFIKAATAVDSKSDMWLIGLTGRFAARWHATQDARYLHAWRSAAETRLILTRNGNPRLAAEVLFSELAHLGVLRNGAGRGNKVP